MTVTVHFRQDRRLLASGDNLSKVDGVHWARAVSYIAEESDIFFPSMGTWERSRITMSQILLLRDVPFTLPLIHCELLNLIVLVGN